jgi:hypothetical protein
MSRSKPADFFLTGLVVVWPALMWCKYYELAVLAFFTFIFILCLCGLLQDLKDDGSAGPRAH